MAEFTKRWTIVVVGLSLLIFSWINPAPVRADSGQDVQLDDITIVVTTPTIPLFPGLDITNRVDPPCQAFDGTAFCPPGVEVIVRIPGSMP